jgi:hypothetical protein
MLPFGDYGRELRAHPPGPALYPYVIEWYWYATGDTSSTSTVDCPLLRHAIPRLYLKAYSLRLLVHHGLNPGLLALFG